MKRRPGPPPNVNANATQMLAAIEELPKGLREQMRAVLVPFLDAMNQQANFNRRVRAAAISAGDDIEDIEPGQDTSAFRRDIVSLPPKGDAAQILAVEALGRRGVMALPPKTDADQVLALQVMDRRETPESPPSDAQRILAARVFAPR